jgi:hypothetical protein
MSYRQSATQAACARPIVYFSCARLFIARQQFGESDKEMSQCGLFALENVRPLRPVRASVAICVEPYLLKRI